MIHDPLTNKGTDESPTGSEKARADLISHCASQGVFDPRSNYHPWENVYQWILLEDAIALHERLDDRLILGIVELGFFLFSWT